MEWLIVAGLGLAVAIFVLLPAWRKPEPHYDWDGTGQHARQAQRMAEIEADVLRYREALRAGTICTRCAKANPEGSRFCADCGTALRNAPPTSEPAGITAP